MRSSEIGMPRADARAPLYPCRRPFSTDSITRATVVALLAVLTLAPFAASTLAADSSTRASDGRSASSDPVPTGSVTVAVASSLRALWPRLEHAWADALPGVTARPTFGASRLLARQIDRGAPFELLLAADEVSVERLSAARANPGDTHVYAVGRLALVRRVTPDGSIDLADDPSRDPVAALADRLDDVRGQRLAIPSPEHAPYGRAAREALTSAGIWPLAAGRLVVGENAAQTLQFVLAGAVDLALVPWSLVSSGAPPGTRASLVPADRHAPIVHRLVTVTDASPAAIALGAWFLGEDAGAVLAIGGLDSPPDARGDR